MNKLLNVLVAIVLFLAVVNGLIALFSHSHAPHHDHQTFKEEVVDR